MKRIPLLAILLSSFILFTCQNDSDPLSGMEDLSPVLAKGETGYAFSNTGTVEPVCMEGDSYATYTFTLWAGKTNDAGTVSITNDENNIYVTYNTNETADLEEVHVYIWTDINDIPVKRPPPGHADYVAENIFADEYTVVIPVEGLECGDVFYISAHAALTGDDPSDEDEPGEGDNSGETAYGGGNNNPGGFPNGKGAWWGYVTFTVECCSSPPPPPDPDCETAFAYDPYWGTCFIDMGMGFNRWGWSIGPLPIMPFINPQMPPPVFVFDIYAGAGQCDISKGTLVGQLLVTQTSELTLTVTYNMREGFYLDETHLYVGSEPLPIDVNGEFTVAPGQYPYIHDLEGARFYTFEVPWNGEPFFVVAHAVVCGTYE